MRAAIFHENGGPEVVRIEQVDVPEPGPGEVRVRVSASSLNHLDLWARRGLPGVPMPHIGGSDIAGVGHMHMEGGVRSGEAAAAALLAAR